MRKYITVVRRVAAQGLPIPTKPTRQYSLADLAFVVLRPPQKLTQADQTVIAELEAAQETLRTACRLARSFAVMVRERGAPALQPWLEQAAASGIAAFRTFVVGLRRDEAAVRAGLTLPWSQGQVEGHIHWSCLFISIIIHIRELPLKTAMGCHRHRRCNPETSF